MPQPPMMEAPVLLVGVRGHERKAPDPDGGVVSGVVRVIATVPVAVLPAGSATVTVGLLVRTVPVQVTIPVLSAGVGLHERFGIVRVDPDSVPVQVTVVAPLVVDGEAVQTGRAGGVVSGVVAIVNVVVVIGPV